MAPARISAASFRPVMNGCIDVEAQLGSTGRWNQRGQGRSESRKAGMHGNEALARQAGMIERLTVPAARAGRGTLR
jgi:hypothetical protein